jgi:hypothetical protein
MFFLKIFSLRVKRSRPSKLPVLLLFVMLDPSLGFRVIQNACDFNFNKDSSFACKGLSPF